MDQGTPLGPVGLQAVAHAESHEKFTAGFDGVTVYGKSSSNASIIGKIFGVPVHAEANAYNFEDLTYGKDGYNKQTNYTADAKIHQPTI